MFHMMQKCEFLWCNSVSVYHLDSGYHIGWLRNIKCGLLQNEYMYVLRIIPYYIMIMKKLPTLFKCYKLEQSCLFSNNMHKFQIILKWHQNDVCLLTNYFHSIPRLCHVSFTVLLWINLSYILAFPILPTLIAIN